MCVFIQGNTRKQLKTSLRTRKLQVIVILSCESRSYYRVLLYLFLLLHSPSLSSFIFLSPLSITLSILFQFIICLFFSPPALPLSFSLKSISICFSFLPLVLACADKHSLPCFSFLHGLGSSRKCMGTLVLSTLQLIDWGPCTNWWTSKHLWCYSLCHGVPFSVCGCVCKLFSENRRVYSLRLAKISDLG